MASHEVAAAPDGEETGKKRAKTDVLLKDVLSLDLPHEDIADLKMKYNHSSPFPYGHIPEIFKADFLEQVIEEIKDNSVVNFKESDLFKVFQSIDLANLTGKSAKMPAVMTLRTILYSEEWRSWMESMNDLENGTLSDQVDCACNCHMAGCHLLCHDDAIRTRKISYILYLTEADPPWNAAEGGALELYDSDVVDGNKNGASRRIPKAVPCKSLLPTFNHMIFFVVEPGYSFHAVQEVLGDRPRLSLQGWYHAAEAPSNMKDATLQRLISKQDQAAAREEDTEGEYAPLQFDSDIMRVHNILSKADRTFLGDFINDTYLKDDAIADIRQRFELESSVQLRNFLTDSWVEKLKASSAEADESRDIGVDPTSPVYYELGVSESWAIVGPAHKQRFLDYTPPSPNIASSAEANSALDTMGSSLHIIRSKLLCSPSFGRFLGQLASLGVPTAHRGKVRRFRPGRDYTVAHYGLLTESSVLDATLCFVAGKGEERSEMRADGEDFIDDLADMDDADELWQSGECGGFECYIAADDESEEGAADEYNQDDDTELLSVSASNNTLSLVFRDPGTMRFIKYVGSKAPSSRWDIAMEYEVPADHDQNDDAEIGVEGDLAAAAAHARGEDIEE